jgi:NAD(P)-dependent dehydrogenase (short-subunit alcohol dehydrogenase family)
MERPVALITGASSGIGRASAALFAREGYAVVLLARTRERLEAVADAIEARTGSPAMVAPCDVSDRSKVEAAVRAALDRFGRLDVLVANAGVGLYARVEDVPPEEFEALWRTNVMGVLHPVQLAVPPMRAAGRGHIAVVGSVVGKRSWPFHGPYAATKFALTALVQALRAELAGSGVTASLILPVRRGHASSSGRRWWAPIVPVPSGRRSGRRRSRGRSFVRCVTRSRRCTRCRASVGRSLPPRRSPSSPIGRLPGGRSDSAGTRNSPGPPSRDSVPGADAAARPGAGTPCLRSG